MVMNLVTGGCSFTAYEGCWPLVKNELINYLMEKMNNQQPRRHWQ